MKTILRIIVCLLFASLARAALPTGLIWEVRSGGATANGGGFNPANANFMTDLAVTAGEGANTGPHVSSSTYTFVAGDVGAWVYVKTGTGWNTGVFYKISSVSAGVAVLDAATGHGVVLGGAAGGWTFRATTVDGIGSATPGGNATYGVDYSQQDSSKLSITDAASTASSTTMTSATGSFTPAMAGNLFHLTTTGTGAFGIIGWYEIVSYTNATTVVTDITTNNGTALVAGTGAVGGGIKTLGAIGSATARLGAVAGNTIFVTQGGGSAFSVGASDTLGFTGTSTNPVQIIGYGTYRGDGYLGRNVVDGKLVLTNMPSYAYSATFKLATNVGPFTVIRDIRFSGAISGALVDEGLSNDNIVFQCVITNSSTNTGAIGVTVGARSILHDSDIFMTGASGGATGAGVSFSSSNCRLIGCLIQMSQSSSAGAAIKGGSTSQAVVLRNTVIGNGGTIGIAMTSSVGLMTIDSNTILGFVDGINVLTGTTGIQCITNNLITDNTANAINCVDAGAPVFNAYNRLRGVSTINNGTNLTNDSSQGDVTTTGAAYSDYVAQASGDYRLASTSPANQAALPASASMGAREPAPAGGTTTYTEISVGGNGGITVRH